MVQKTPRGTGHALLTADSQLRPHDKVIVLNSDMPLIRKNTLTAMIRSVTNKDTLTILAATTTNPKGYGRVITDTQGQALRIVEEKDATPQQKKIQLFYSGVIAGYWKTLRPLLKVVKKNPAHKEYYLTDIIALANAKGLACLVRHTTKDEVLGVNDKLELARAEEIMQQRLRQKALRKGVTLQDANSVFFSQDTTYGTNVTIAPHVVLGKGVRLGNHVTLLPFSYCQDTTIANGATVGPYARLRGKVHIGARAEIGNFVEIKNSTLGPKVKVKHLAYIGDTTIGEQSNVGAGTITCNYDGTTKHQTTIGKNSFIGSNSTLVAPVKIEDDAYVGAGTVVTKPVKKGMLATTRAPRKDRRKNLVRAHLTTKNKATAKK